LANLLYKLTRDYITDFDRGFIHPGSAAAHTAERMTHPADKIIPNAWRSVQVLSRG
jgi:hypothetical protein